MLRSDRGSALMLMPAAVLVVMVLAAITMDLSLVHLGRRETMAAAEAAANDAATFGLDERAYRTGAGYALDPVRAHRAMQQSIAAAGLADDLASPPQMAVLGTTVQVRLTIRVNYVFARALPGVAHSTTVTATGSATPVAR
jgi:Flp pilus assembly protein TadG